MLQARRYRYLTLKGGERRENINAVESLFQLEELDHVYEASHLGMLHLLERY
jgi:hypothetical protein